MTLSEFGQLCEDVAKILGVLAAASGALVGVITMARYGKIWATKFKDYTVAWFKMPTVVQEQSEKIHAIEQLVNKELTANGGSSIRDAISRIDKRQILDETRNRAMLEQLGVPFWEADADGKLIYLSQEFCRLTNRLVDEMLGHGWINALHHDYRDEVIKEWNDALAQGRGFTMNFSYVTPNGIEVPVKVETILLKDKAGHTIGHIGKVWRLSA